MINGATKILGFIPRNCKPFTILDAFKSLFCAFEACSCIMVNGKNDYTLMLELFKFLVPRISSRPLSIRNTSSEF